MLATDARADETPADGGTNLSGVLETDTRQLAILDALSRGVPYRQIAAEYRVGLATLVQLAKRQAALETGAVAKLMQGKALAMLEHWEKAAETGAAAGKHAPARDWLVTAKAIAPPQDAPQAPRVAIIIGTSEHPVDVSSLQVVDAEVVTAED